MNGCKIKGRTNSRGRDMLAMERELEGEEGDGSRVCVVCERIRVEVCHVLVVSVSCLTALARRGVLGG
jgi:hypothetical protein